MYTASPEALFSVNRQTPKLQARALLRLSHRPSDGLEIQNQLICGSPTDGGATETGVNLPYPVRVKKPPYLRKGAASDTVLQHYHNGPSRVNVINTLEDA